MATLRQLSRRLDKVVRKLDVGLTTVVTTVATSIAAELVPDTPVLTGFARGNWRPALNSPPTVPITFLDPTGQATIAKIGAVASRFRIGDVLYIANLIPYIEQLDAGSSPQAPPGFVKDAVLRGFARGIKSFQGGIIKSGLTGAKTTSGGRDPLTGRFI
jgi:hypothetical protein